MTTLHSVFALGTLGLALGNCSPRLGMLEVPATVQAGAAFSVTVHGNQTSALQGGLVGCVVQVPNSVTVTGFVMVVQSIPVQRDDPALLGLYTAEPGHYLASFSGGLMATNAAVTVLLQAPAAAAGPLIVKVALAGDAPVTWTPADPIAVTDFAAIGGANSKSFTLVPDPPRYERTVNGLPNDLYEVAIGDVDGDGNDDLVGLPMMPSTLQVGLSRPGAPFQVRTTNVTPMPNMAGLALGDFDADGHLDVALVSQVWFGDGLGGFVPGPAFPSIGTMMGTAVGDVDGDGIDDIAFVGQATIAQVFRSNGNRTFSNWSTGLPQQPTPNQYFDRAVLLRDVTRDGFADLVVAHHASLQRIDVFVGNGQGSWAPMVQIPTAGAPGQIACGDLTGDGFDDLVVACGSTAFQAFEYQGNQQWTVAPLGPVPGTHGGGIALLDFDRDGRLDVALSDAPGHQTVAMWCRMRLLRNAGGGTFVEQAHSGLTSFGRVDLWLATGDLDGDTFPDLATDRGMQLVWRNTGTGLSPFGEGCAAAGHAPSLDTNGAPSLGNAAFALQLHDGVASGGGLLWLGFSKRYAFGIAQLPFDLTAFGAPGCAVLAEQIALRFVLHDAQGLAAMPLPLPNDPSLHRLLLFAQGAALVPGANALGALFSGGLALRLD